MRFDRNRWTGDYPPRLLWGRWEKGDSLLEWCSVNIVRNALFLAAFPATIADGIWRRRTDDVPPKPWAECWVLGWLALGVLSLFWWADSVPILAAGAAVCILIDNASVIGSKLTGPIVNLGRSPVRSHPRVLMLTLLNAGQVVVAFAVLMFIAKSSYTGLACPTQALYLSALTFTTLGYGDITPAANFGRWLVVAELSFFLLLVAAVLPQAVAELGTRETDKAAKGE